MRLSEITKGIQFSQNGPDQEVSGLYHNSGEVKPGGLFFAIDGTRQRGSDFICEAIARGAKVIVASREYQLQGITSLRVEDVRLAMSLMAGNYYNNPSRDMKIIGVTGTNGKTTTTFMLASVFAEAGKSVGIIGTNGEYINGKKISQDLTTPDPIFLHKTLALFRKEGVEVVCMEISAHALELQKIRGIMTDIALFTNLTQDHLDFFGDMNRYADAKRKLFDGLSRQAVLNLDDEFGQELYRSCHIPRVGYSRKDNVADIIAYEQTHNTSYQTFCVTTPSGKGRVTLKLAGGFNVSNALGVIGAAQLCGIDLETIIRGLEKLERVDGRFNTYDVDGIRVVVDYAHTPDGLENILRAAREITNGKVYCVFGCGGNRDRKKRPIMGAIAERLADYTIVTSDNPRFENPSEIAADITSQMRGKFAVELDRARAIEEAISLASSEDTVVIAGKGSEDYIDMLGVKTSYEDRLVLKKIIEERKK